MKQTNVIVFAVLVALTPPARAQDAPPPETLNRIIDSPASGCRGPRRCLRRVLQRLTQYAACSRSG